MDTALVDQEGADNGLIRHRGELIDLLSDRDGDHSISQTFSAPRTTARGVSKLDKSFRELVVEAERKFEDFVEREQQRAFAQRKDIFRVLAAVYAVHLRRLENPSAYDTFLRQRAVTRDKRCKTEGAITIKAFVPQKQRSSANMRERISQYGRALEVLAHRGVAPSEVVEWFELEEIIANRLRRGFEKAKYAYKLLPGEQERVEAIRKIKVDAETADLAKARKRPLGRAVMERGANTSGPGMVLLVAEADTKGGLTILQAIPTTERKAASLLRQHGATSGVDSEQ